MMAVFDGYRTTSEQLIVSLLLIEPNPVKNATYIKSSLQIWPDGLMKNGRKKSQLLIKSTDVLFLR